MRKAYQNDISTKLDFDSEHMVPSKFINSAKYKEKLAKKRKNIIK